MNQSILRVTAVAAFAFAAAAHADAVTSGKKLSEEQVMQACVQQFIAANLAEYQGKVTVNTLSAGYQPVVLSARTQVMVSAKHRATGAHLGTVVCDVAKDGKVTVAAPSAIAAERLEKLIKSPVVASNSAE